MTQLSPTALEEAAKAAYDKFNENLIGCCETTWSGLSEDVQIRMRDSATAAITAYLAQAEKEGWVMVPKENLQFIADMSGERSIRQEARSMLAAAQNGGEPCK